MKLTVITPTIFRNSLWDTIRNVDSLLDPGDEHLIIGDGEHWNVPTGDVSLPGRYTAYHRVTVPGSQVGNAQRDFALSIAKGDCAIFIDDDDLPGRSAFAVLHQLPADRNVTHFFRMRLGDKTCSPHRGMNNAMGGPQCVPPIREDLPKWMELNKYEVDQYFIDDVLKLPGMTVETHDEIICHVECPNFGAL